MYWGAHPALPDFTSNWGAHAALPDFTSKPSRSSTTPDKAELLHRALTGLKQTPSQESCTSAPCPWRRPSSGDPCTGDRAPAGPVAQQPAAGRWKPAGHSVGTEEQGGLALDSSWAGAGLWGGRGAHIRGRWVFHNAIRREEEGFSTSAAGVPVHLTPHRNLYL